MADKYLTAIATAFEDYFKDRLFEITVEPSDEFWYDPDIETIGFTLFDDAQSEQDFCKFFEEELHCPKCNTIIYSIFHEYGHYMTLDDFSGKELRQYHKSAEDLSNASNTTERNYKYFTLPPELAASEWAVEYITAHYDDLATWYEEKLFPLIKDAIENSDFIREMLCITAIA